jgi:Host cell surface-exposed lipoprotein
VALSNCGVFLADEHFQARSRAVEHQFPVPSWTRFSYPCNPNNLRARPIYRSGWDSTQPTTNGRDILFKKILGGIAAVVIVIVIIAALSSHGSTPPAASATSPAAATSSAPAPSSSAPAAPQYSVAQEQAIQAAQQYLSMDSGFSRAGLIQQLDSSAGSGFSKSLARFAVSHIKVNWDHQAALAAKGYMQMGGFSYSGMVQQLDSSAGDGFTHAQAVFGAKSVGL